MGLKEPTQLVFVPFHTLCSFLKCPNIRMRSVGTLYEIVEFMPYLWSTGSDRAMAW